MRKIGDMPKKYRITLSQAEREQLQSMTQSGQANVRALKRAQMLLKANDSPDGPGWTDVQIAEALDAHPMTVLYVRRRYCQHGLQSVVSGQYTGHNPAIITGEVEAHLIALACSEPPAGHEHWTLQLLAERLVALDIVEHISDETVRLGLKKTNLSLGSNSNGALRRRPTPRS